MPTMEVTDKEQRLILRLRERDAAVGQSPEVRRAAALLRQKAAIEAELSTPAIAAAVASLAPAGPAGKVEG